MACAEICAEANTQCGVDMSQDIAKLLEDYLSDDPYRWGKLSSDIQFRRLELLLLREILLELRKLNQGFVERKPE